MITAAVEKQAVWRCERYQGIWQPVQRFQNSLAPERVLVGLCSHQIQRCSVWMCDLTVRVNVTAKKHE